MRIDDENCLWYLHSLGHGTLKEYMIEPYQIEDIGHTNFISLSIDDGCYGIDFDLNIEQAKVLRNFLNNKIKELEIRSSSNED